MKILALDQSTKVTGWSTWSNGRLLKYGAMMSDVKEDNPIERMAVMSALIRKLIKEQKPKYVVFEQVQFQRNYRVYSQLSQLQGVIFDILFQEDIQFTLIEPTAWKKFFGIDLRGTKRAEQKASTIHSVKEKYGVEVSEDEADAIGIGFWATKNICE